MGAYDAITAEQLRAVGGMKWSAFPESVGAWIAEMDFGLAEPIAAALHDAVARGLVGYLPPRLTADLAQAFAGFAVDRYGWAVDPGDVRPLPDVLTALSAIIERFTPAGSPVIVPTPAYMPFLTIPGYCSREVVQVAMVRDGDRYVYDLDALAAAFTVPGQLFVLCNPHNPIGRVLEPAELLAISEVVEAKGGRVFSDEIHAPLVFDGHRHVPYASLNETTAGHTITATSASKAWNLPGLKAAQLVLSNDADRAVWQARAGRTAEGTSTLGVIAHTAAYTGALDWLDATIGYLDANRRELAGLVAEHLPGAEYIPPEGTYLGWLDLREAGLPAEPADYLRSHAGVAATSGAACGAPGFLRYNFATPAPIMRESIAAIGAAVAR
ncbi:MalY/PatB family protein [Pseudactinotalea sp. HY158]|uniref:MalY/PatB family protein n=1 Tax=Pseudactinotalea sp. HY158 TaxID=2654547 RepID=UPI00129C27DC|nr:aminotransferase class I/II-fold pyridoxal phosphate-dependent enzyme [Pseudactinotalea sp. HY158]QGH69153.1 aminotransferase class I/II-fold pyridoxal phosphate-dependent enzyme [Pseudactinotalea sp. HY158]